MKRLVVMTSLFAGLLLGSCATNNVASGGLIQKRKHNKGFHLNFPSKVADRAGEDVADMPIDVNTPVSAPIQHVPSTSPSVASSTNDHVEAAEPVLIQETEVAHQDVSTRKSVSKSTPQESVIQYMNRRGRSSFSTVSETELSKDSWSAQKENKSNSLFAVELIILVLLAFLLPPLAVYLSEGSWNTRCWISLILTLLFWIPGIIFALYVVLV